MRRANDTPHMSPERVWMWYGLLSAVVSCVTFVAYGWDKRAAGKGRRRTAESTLHGMELCGGWVGGWVGQRVWRHKTQKSSYQLVFWLIGLVHLGIVSALLWWTFS